MHMKQFVKEQMNVEKFTGKAVEYDKFRPSYPRKLYRDILLEASLTKESIIADIGAGTGKFSLPFLQEGYKVFCIEPNADMKSIMDRNLGSFVHYVGLNATAEKTMLVENSIDCIVVAQAFHWFDKKEFQKECRRILKPFGKVFLVWNTRDESAASTQELYAVNKKYCPNFKGFSGGVNFSDENKFNDFFKKGAYSVKEYNNDIIYDNIETFVGRSLSSSYSLKSFENGYNEYISDLKIVYKKYAERGVFTLKQKTIIFWGEM